MPKKKLTTQEDAVVYFIEQLDIDMVNTLLDNNRTYQDFSKDVFIQKLDEAFDVFLKSGDTCLTRSPGQCHHRDCNLACRGYSFTGNSSKKHLDLIIEKTNPVRCWTSMNAIILSGMEKKRQRV
jgi:hypothetical protein